MYKLSIEKKIRIFATCVLALVFLLFFSGVRKLFLKAFLSPIKFYYSVSRYCGSKQYLAEENESLRETIGSLSLEVDRFRGLRDENKRLRALLKFEEKIQFDTVSAEVIVRNPNDWIGSFVINKGTADGVQKDSAVCSARGLLGKVVEAGKNTSSVMLITHPGFKAGAMLKESRINGIVTGAGKGRAKILYLPIDAEVKEGAVVVTAGFSRLFPKGITIGEIVSVGKSKTGLYKYATIKPSADCFSQEEVLCIK